MLLGQFHLQLQKLLMLLQLLPKLLQLLMMLPQKLQLEPGQFLELFFELFVHQQLSRFVLELSLIHI